MAVGDGRAVVADGHGLRERGMAAGQRAAQRRHHVADVALVGEAARGAQGFGNLVDVRRHASTFARVTKPLTGSWQGG